MKSKLKGNKKKAFEAYNAIQAAMSVVMSRLYRAKAFGDLSPTQYSVMATLLEHGSVNQTGLCGFVSKTNGDMVFVVDNLSKRGLVRREGTQEDGRVKMAVLTEAGRKHIASLVEHHDQAVQEAMSAFNENQLDALMEIAETLAGKEECEG